MTGTKEAFRCLLGYLKDLLKTSLLHLSIFEKKSFGHLSDVFGFTKGLSKVIFMFILSKLDFLMTPLSYLKDAFRLSINLTDILEISSRHPFVILKTT
jgi:hypothetical protein